MQLGAAAIFYKNLGLKLTREMKTRPNALYGDYSGVLGPDRLFLGWAAFASPGAILRDWRQVLAGASTTRRRLSSFLLY